MSSSLQYSLHSKTISLQKQDQLDVDLHSEGHFDEKLVHFESNGEESLVQEAATLGLQEQMEKEKLLSMLNRKGKKKLLKAIGMIFLHQIVYAVKIIP